MFKPQQAILLLAMSGTALAGPYDPPASEYNNIDSVVASSNAANLASNLRAALDSLTSVASHVSYQNGRFRYDESDLDLDNPGRIILIYNGASVNSTWDSGSTFNREHTWPRSHMFNDSTGSLEYTDFHQLRPCNPSLNSSRGNEPFGLGSNNLWDPGAGSFDDQDRGEMARAMFYQATRHALTLIECTNANQLSDGQMGDRSTLLRWHFEHVADEREYFRNDTIDDSIQFNRNPFVDRNEYVWAIFGTGPNDSQITLDGASPTAGATSVSIDLGDVIVGNGFAASDRPITKTGTAPTTYRVYTTGDAVTDTTDVTIAPSRSSRGFGTTITTDDWRTRNLAFTYGPSSLSATVEGATLYARGEAGARAGTVVIDNTDLTSAGAGQGVADGDDVVTLTGREVDHANASFDMSMDVNTLAVDFGAVATGAIEEVRITNLQAPSGFTAGLRVTGVAGTGDTGAFDLGTIPTLTEIAGGLTSFNPVSVVATAPGLYSATYTIDVADSPIPGAAANTSLTLTLVAEVEDETVLCVADFDGNGVVDLTDFGVFGAEFGRGLPGGGPACDASNPCQADFDNNGVVDLTDFGVFGTEFGNGLPGGGPACSD